MPVCLPLETLKAIVPILAAAAAALIAVLSWFGKLLVSYLEQLYVRRRQCIDLMIAIRSEIRTNLETEGALARADGKTITAIPYFASTNEPPLLASLSSNFLLLPEDVGARVFRYFNLSQALDAQIKDFRSDAFKKIGWSRQKSVYVDTIKLAGLTESAGQSSVVELENAIASNRNRQVLEPALAAAAAFILFVAGVINIPAFSISLFNAVEGSVASCSVAPSTKP